MIYNDNMRNKEHCASDSGQGRNNIKYDSMVLSKDVERDGEDNGTPLQYSCLENSWTEEPGRLQSIGSLRVGNDWVTSLSLFTFLHWRRKWQPTPVFLPGESQGPGSLVGCCLWGCTESDTTERLRFHFSLSCIGEGNGNPLQYSCLENPRDGGAWWAAVCVVAQSRTWLKDLAAEVQVPLLLGILNTKIPRIIFI